MQGIWVDDIQNFDVEKIQDIRLVDDSEEECEHYGKKVDGSCAVCGEVKTVKIKPLRLEYSSDTGMGCKKEDLIEKVQEIINHFNTK